MTRITTPVSPQLEGIGGRYFEDGNEAVVVACRGQGQEGVAPYALDPDNAGRVWDESAQLMA